MIRSSSCLQGVLFFTLGLVNRIVSVWLDLCRRLISLEYEYFTVLFSSACFNKWFDSSPDPKRLQCQRLAGPDSSAPKELPGRKEMFVS